MSDNFDNKVSAIATELAELAAQTGEIGYLKAAHALISALGHLPDEGPSTYERYVVHNTLTKTYQAGDPANRAVFGVFRKGTLGVLEESLFEGLEDVNRTHELAELVIGLGPIDQVRHAGYVRADALGWSTDSNGEYLFVGANTPDVVYVWRRSWSRHNYVGRIIGRKISNEGQEWLLIVPMQGDDALREEREELTARILAAIKTVGTEFLYGNSYGEAKGGWVQPDGTLDSVPPAVGVFLPHVAGNHWPAPTELEVSPEGEWVETTDPTWTNGDLPTSDDDETFFGESILEKLRRSKIAPTDEE